MIIYSSSNEVIVCEKSNEKQLLLDYFEEGGRDLEDFDREEIKRAFHVTGGLHVS